jgi:hypothetical protein
LVIFTGFNCPEKAIEAKKNFDFAPFYISTNEKHLIGFIKKNYGEVSTYFKYPDWKNFKYLGIWAHECD